MQYKFYGAGTPSVRPTTEEFSFIGDQRDLYERLDKIWCAKSCAPRMRELWVPENKTLGQCSVTSFLIQDIYGGKVYGVPLPGGGYHCFNEVGGVVFDLTSEQFGEEKLCYDLLYEQSREVHFADKEKYQRYLYLKEKLKETK